MASFWQIQGMQRETELELRTLSIPLDVWLAITEAIRLLELATRRKRKKDTKDLPHWARYHVLTSDDLLSLSSVCRHFRQALFPVALERLRVYKIPIRNAIAGCRKTQPTELKGSIARMSKILEPEGAGHKELVREFAYRSEAAWCFQEPTLKSPWWVRVLQLLTNVRLLHLTNVDIDVETLLGLTKLQHLRLRDCRVLDSFPANRSPEQARLHLQSLQLCETRSYFVGSKDQFLLDFFVSPALTHLRVDEEGFMLVPWTSCTALRELVLTISGGLAKPGPEEFIAVLETCISLEVLYLDGVGLQKEHALRLGRLESLRTITCDVGIVEYLVPGRPMEHLRLHLTDYENEPSGRQARNWKTILEAARKSTLPIKTLTTIDLQGCDPQYTRQALDQLVGAFGALEELGLLVPDQQAVIDAIPFVARLESLRKICIKPAEALMLDPEVWFSWQEAQMRDFVALSKSKQLGEVDFGFGHTWRWLELKSWLYSESGEVASKQIEL